MFTDVKQVVGKNLQMQWLEMIFSNNQVGPYFTRQGSATKILLIGTTLCTTNPSQREKLLAFISLCLCGFNHFFLMNALSEPLSYTRCIFKARVIQLQPRRGKDSVKGIDSTIFSICDFNLQGIGKGNISGLDSASNLSMLEVL